MKQILAIGGGGFTNPTSLLKMEKFLLSLTKKKHPKICFLPQASNEDRDYVLKFFKTFTKLGADPSWVSLFGRVEDTWKQHLLNQDIIYVGGGNTKSMMALWKAWKMDKVLLEAYQKGIILAGISAGAICWFEQGITDSVWPLGIVKGLGFLEGSVCPHFDSEQERQAVYRNNVKKKLIKPGIALEDNTAAYFLEGKFKKIVIDAEGKKARKINRHSETILKTKLI